MNRNEVIDVLTAVAAADRRTVGEADVDVWQAVIGDLSVDLCLQAVRDHIRTHPGVWIEPGHVYQGARAIRRDYLDRHPEESYAAIAARSEALAIKAREDAENLAERKGITYLDPPKFKRNANPHLAVACPFDGCRVAVGQHCANKMTGRRPAGGVHPSRIELATTGQVQA